MDTISKWEIKQNQPQIIAELDSARSLAVQAYQKRIGAGIDPIAVKHWFRTYTYVDLGIVTDFNQDGESEPAQVYANAEGQLFYRLMNGQFVEFTNKNTPLWTAEYIAYGLKRGNPPSSHGM